MRLPPYSELCLPASARITSRLNPARFRRCLATEPLPEPFPLPPTAGPMVVSEGVGPGASVHWDPEIPGLGTLDAFLSEDEAAAVMAAIDGVPWDAGMRRRVQHYGWRYDYKRRSVDRSQRIGPLPDWAQALAERLHHQRLLAHVPDQVIVNEYVGKQGISKHVDCEPCFDDGIAMVSLLETWDMVFRPVGDKTPRLARPLAARSVAILARDARYDWTHEIPARKTERRRPRGRRVSLTFRRVRPDP